MKYINNKALMIIINDSTTYVLTHMLIIML